MKRIYQGVLIVAGLALTLGITATVKAAEKNMWGDKQVGDRRTGYTYATQETRSIQDDDFENPAMVWVDDGAKLWNTVDGSAGKSCASCHNDAASSMKGVAVRYPVFDPKLGKLKNVEQQINICRTERMKAKAYKWESHDMLSITMYVNHQSRGMKQNVSIDGPAAPFFKKGEEFFNQRRGQLDLACKHCHQDFAGVQIRANILTQGQINGFPTYRLKWQKPGSTHRRYRGCNKMVRASALPYGSDEYVDLELYMKWRGRGLPIEAPAVRN